ncbi:MAG: 2-oxo acid dehydrogenase subunit E2, partial [Myxococcales bacterium]|nr:2-oxo acid dehydrogenase subunit E2 [Myxococcales bacterium]
MPMPWNDPGDQIVPISPAESAINDAFQALRKPWVIGVWELDCKPMLDLIARRPLPDGRKLTMTPILARALALALREHPGFNRMYRGSKVIQPSSIDIGISVAVQSVRLSPVVVLKSCDTMSVEAIVAEIDAKSAEIRANEKKQMDDMNRLARWFPFPFLRRLLIRYFFRRDWMARAVSGTFQISNFGSTGVEAAYVPVVCSQMLGVGEVKRRPVAVGDRVEV